MVPIKGEWTRFIDFQDELKHLRSWGLIPPKSEKVRPVMVTDGYFGTPQPCKVVGYQGDNWAVIELADGFHAIHGDYLAELQPVANQKLPHGICFTEILSKYIVLDIETTGFDFHSDRIIEIAAVLYEYGEKISEYHTLINPGMLLPPSITSLTGITQADVNNAPALEEVESEFLSYIGTLPIIGHNALTFDIPFLSAQLNCKIENPVIDTLPMVRKTFDLLPRHKLEYLNDVLKLGSAGSHRAFNDVETTNALMWACLSPRKYEQLVHRAFLDERLNGKIPSKKKRPAPKNTIAPSKRKFEKVDIKSIVPDSDCSASSSPLCGKAIVFTGELGIPREEAMQLAVNAGAILKSSVSRKIAYLIVGRQDVTIVGFDGMSSKEEKALELNKSGKSNIKIIREDEFLQMVKKEGSAV